MTTSAAERKPHDIPGSKGKKKAEIEAAITAIVEREHAAYDELIVRCGLCDWTFTGGNREATAQAVEHRDLLHPESKGKRRRGSKQGLERLQAKAADRAAGSQAVAKRQEADDMVWLTNEAVLEQIRSFHAKNGRWPKTADFTAENRLLTPSSVKRRFGTQGAALEKAKAGVAALCTECGVNPASTMPSNEYEGLCKECREAAVEHDVAVEELPLTAKSTDPDPAWEALAEPMTEPNYDEEPRLPPAAESPWVELPIVHTGKAYVSDPPTYDIAMALARIEGIASFSQHVYSSQNMEKLAQICVIAREALGLDDEGRRVERPS